jgi:hypothetical protein
MKKILITLAWLIAGLILTGCYADTSKVGLDEEFSLSIGESAKIRGEDFEITFLEVLEDSRCPKDVECIWAGRATSLVKIKTTDSAEDFELIETGLTDLPNRLTYDGYWIYFSLLPYPELPGGIDADEYRLQLTVSKMK